MAIWGEDEEDEETQPDDGNERVERISNVIAVPDAMAVNDRNSRKVYTFIIKHNVCKSHWLDS